jgi:hypothetical protein
MSCLVKCISIVINGSCHFYDFDAIFLFLNKKSANMGVKNTIKVTYGMHTNWGALILDE